MSVITRTVLAGVAALAVCGSASAGQVVPPPSPPEPPGKQAVAEPTVVDVDAQADAELKRQVSLFEGVLRQAVESGGQRLAMWARQVVPGVVLAQASNPMVQAVPLPDSSLVFNVQVPEILQTSVMLFQQLQRPRGPQPVSVPGGVASTGVPVGRVSDPDNLDPDRRYSDYVREALIDALLEGSGVLQLHPGQWLTVAASGVDVAVTNPLYRNPSRRLVLSVRADDLLAMRQGRLSRDETRSRILERRF